MSLDAGTGGLCHQRAQILDVKLWRKRGRWGAQREETGIGYPDSPKWGNRGEGRWGRPGGRVSWELGKSAVTDRACLSACSWEGESDEDGTGPLGLAPLRPWKVLGRAFSGEAGRLAEGGLLWGASEVRRGTD